ncbi:MAG TPA: DNA-formamidopyrimidine glycosylase family protein [Blastocatellia bacterium]|nr:DNA-formamidopyrimidine glycosylase family protein [Blastocatellia bacterium]
MPELPDVTAYISALDSRVVNQTLKDIRLLSPFLLRSVDPPLALAFGKKVKRLLRLGKRIVIELEDDLFLIIHLMIAGRLHWKDGSVKLNRRTIAAFIFSSGTLTMTEAGTKKRASLYLVRGKAGLTDHDRGGLEVLDADPDSFRDALTRENHTLKRALTDPHLFSGIGNAYSDEILHAAGLSPMKLTRSMQDAEIKRLYKATQETLRFWIEKLGAEARLDFPEKVTAFREDMAVHGRYGKPCPKCGTPIQRIVYAANEANYCPSCQTGDKLLADRALSRLLKQDWPRTLEELEEHRRVRRQSQPTSSGLETRDRGPESH